MQKKLSLTLILLALLPLMVLIILWPGTGARISHVRAAPVNSSFTAPYNISSPRDYDASQRARAARDAEGYLNVVWMDGVINKSTGPAYVRGRDTTWPVWDWIGPNNNGGYVNPVIAIDNSGTLHVAYSSDGPPYDVWYTSKPVGGSWTSRVNLSNDTYNSVFSSIAVDSTGRVWVAWQTSITDQNNDVFVRTKPAGGSWEPVMNVSNRTPEDQNPSIAVGAGDVLHLVWRSREPGNWEIIHTRYVGGAWTPFLNVSATSRGSHFPRMATGSGNNMYVVWEEELSSDVFFTAFRRWDGGQWLPLAYVSDPIKALYPSLGTDRAGNIYAVWTDYRSNTETYFSYSTDEGATWSADENVSQNGTASFYPDIAAEIGGFVHIFWQDTAPGSLDIFYSKGTIPVGPPPTPTHTPSPTYTPSPTQPPQPHGYVDILAHDPLNHHDYTRLLDVTLELSATSEVGAQITEMRVCNQGACNPLPAWQAFVTSLPNWSLLDDGSNCGSKSVLAWFRDEYGQESSSYSDHIVYDNYLAANMVLNGDNPYTNRTMVMVNSQDEPGSCSGLLEMRVREDTGTFTSWISFNSRLYFFLSPSGGSTRTVYAEYRDRANNNGSDSDSIMLDLSPPYSGTAPTMPGSTTQLLIQISGLQAQDDESGVAKVWIANRSAGPWKTFPYCASPPCSYTWNLGYGGPPAMAPDLHTVYVKYEDGAGYESFPGNFSPTYQGTISVSGISCAYLPCLRRGLYQSHMIPPAASDQARLILIADPDQAGPGQDVWLYLAVRRELDPPLEGTLRLVLPAGLRVVRAWSAYGQLLQVEDGLVVSHERAWSGQVAWIAVQAHLEQGAGASLFVQGEMNWDGGGTLVTSEEIEGR